MRLRVATYNVHGLRRPFAVARVIRELRADIVLVQEYAAKVLLWPVARAAGMSVAVRQPPGRPFMRNAVLVSGDVAVVRAWPVQLPSTPPREARGAMLAEVEVGRARFVVASVHLGLKDAERVAHARLLVEELERTELPCVLGGDLNERPGAPAAALLATRYTDVLGERDELRTYPTPRPDSRIDFLFVSGGAAVSDVRVVDSAVARRASDHLPVAAVIEVEA